MTGERSYPPRQPGFAFEDKPEGGRYELIVIGSRRLAGWFIPEFTLKYYDIDDSVIKQLNQDSFPGKVTIISTVNALNTPVCDRETQCWDEKLEGLGPNVQLITVSKQEPEVLAEWARQHSTKHLLVSSQNTEFDERFGVGLKEEGVEDSEWENMLLRAVFVIKDDKFVYTDYVDDQMKEPDYDRVAEAVKAALAYEVKLIDDLTTEEMVEIAQLTGGVAKTDPQLRRINGDGVHNVDFPLQVEYPNLGIELDFYKDPSDQWMGPEKPALVFANGDYVSLANAAVIRDKNEFLLVNVSGSELP